MHKTNIITATVLSLSLFSSASLLAEIDVTPAPANPPTAGTLNSPATEQPAGQAPKTPETETPNLVPEPLTTSLDNQGANDPREKIKNAVVKIYVVQHTYETLSPWNSDSQKGSGSGLIIAGNLILTNAHVASDATFLEVQRHGETTRYEAEVVYISHESDLALLRTKDVSAYQKVQPLELGDLPKMQQQVEVYGFPIGGDTLSVTRGVVSRIEKQNYVHTGENLIAAQVDAAINFGNSGGPVISDGKVVGVAMQSGFLTENIGYMIPTPIIRHFLDDVKDRKVDGYGFHGFLAQSLENPSMRHKYGLQTNQTGMLVHKIYENSPSQGKIELGDIVTDIDGHSIENNGTVEFRPGEFIDYTHYIDMHQIGDDLQIKLIRKGQVQNVTLYLDKPGKEYLLVKPTEYDKQPTYFIYGGLVFMPLNQNVISSMDAAPPQISTLTYESPTPERSEAVILTKVLPADINKDYHHTNNLLIEKVNGETVHSFADFFQKLQTANSDFITLEGPEHFQLVLDRQECIKRQPGILKQYGINSDRSADLTQPVSTLPAVATPATTTPPVAMPLPAIPAPPTLPALPAAPTVVAPQTVVPNANGGSRI